MRVRIVPVFLDLILISCMISWITISGLAVDFDIKVDKPLKVFLLRLAKVIEEHRWNDVLTYFDPENFRVQREIGVSTPQYIADGLGLGYVDNHLIPREGDSSEYSKLNSIETTRYTGYETTEWGGIIIRGKVALYNGEYRDLTLYIVQTDGGYTMQPPVG